MGATAPSQPTTAPGATPPPAQENAIEVQPTEEPVDEDEFETSDYDASSTASTSVTSSIYQHHYENGRRVRPLFPLELAGDISEETGLFYVSFLFHFISFYFITALGEAARRIE